MILTVLLAIPIAITLLYVIKEIFGYRRLKFYTNQGMKSVYTPIVGYAHLFMGSAKNDFTKKYLDFQL